MLLYDFNLAPLSNSLLPILPPGAGFSIVTVVGNNILFAIAAREELDQPDSFDHYTIDGRSLTYVGSYPLYGTDPVDFNKVILLADIGRLSIDYGSTTISFDVNYPPQSLRGYFFDSVEQDCQAYDQALFKPNPVLGIYDMLVLNSYNLDLVVLERYTFTEKTQSLLTKTSSVTLDNYLYSGMQV